MSNWTECPIIKRLGSQNQCSSQAQTTTSWLEGAEPLFPSLISFGISEILTPRTITRCFEVLSALAAHRLSRVDTPEVAPRALSAYEIRKWSQNNEVVLTGRSYRRFPHWWDRYSLSCGLCKTSRQSSAHVGQHL